MAHFDRIIWRGTILGATFDPWRLEPIIRQTLATIAGYGRALELNTRHLRRRPGWNEALVTMLRWFRLAGGTAVIVNSDAHHAHQLGRNRVIAHQLLLEAGFQAPTRLQPLGNSDHSYATGYRWRVAH